MIWQYSCWVSLNRISSQVIPLLCASEAVIDRQWVNHAGTSWSAQHYDQSISIPNGGTTFYVNGGTCSSSLMSRSMIGYHTVVLVCMNSERNIAELCEKDNTTQVIETGLTTDFHKLLNRDRTLTDCWLVILGYAG